MLRVAESRLLLRAQHQEDAMKLGFIPANRGMFNERLQGRGRHRQLRGARVTAHAESHHAVGRGCRIAKLQSFYRDALLRHFPHHVAITQANVGNVL
jgi:hypothetical protein